MSGINGPSVWKKGGKQEESPFQGQSKDQNLAGLPRQIFKRELQ